jgi:MFS family permease
MACSDCPRELDRIHEPSVSCLDRRGTVHLTASFPNEACIHTTQADILTQVVAVYIAGEAVGALTQTAIADKLGRVRFMELMCVVVTIGTTIQTASMNIGMFLAGRALAGFAVGWVAFQSAASMMMLTRASAAWLELFPSISARFHHLHTEV